MKIAKELLRLSCAAALATLLWGCETAPYTGRSQFIMTSESQEAQLGDDAWKEICGQEKASTNVSQNTAVARVGRDIASAVNKPNYKWEFRLFESAEANAFCLPGGKVAVYSGIFKYMDNDAELAAVVGHEVGHAVARHGGERISQAMAQQIGAEAVSAASGEQYRAAVEYAYGIGTNVGVMLPYSRTQEYEADRLGMIFMAQAGYDPSATISFWQKFSQVAKMSSIEEYFSTHPMSEKRIEEMKKNLPEAMSYYQKASVKKALGQSYKGGEPSGSAAAAIPATGTAVPTSSLAPKTTKPKTSTPTVNNVGEPQKPVNGTPSSGGSKKGTTTQPAKGTDKGGASSNTIKRQYDSTGKTAAPSDTTSTTSGTTTTTPTDSTVIKRKYGTIESN